jgi:hypothetical protein
MRHSRSLVALVAALVPLSCNWGTRPNKLPAAQRAVGARVSVYVSGERGVRAGELYAADSTGVTFRGARLVRVDWPRLGEMDVDRMDARYDVRRGEVVGAEKRARIALVSRFPQGLDGELLARVLAQLGQDTLDTVP